MNCRYCGQSEFANGTCKRCGASTVEPEPEKKIQEDAPGFAYNGHWVIGYSPDDFGDIRKYRFYLGPQLMAVIPVDRRLLQELLGPVEHYTTSYHDRVMKFIWELYLIAVGDQQEYVLEWENRNSLIKPATFVVTKAPVELDEQHKGMGLTYRQLFEIRDKVLA